MIKFPKGIANFYDIITEGYFYVDRTSHIPLIEQAGKTTAFPPPTPLWQEFAFVDVRELL